MLTAGMRLGVYEVAGPLGAGGMGEVYRARDTRLGRDVALKILPDAFATDPDRLARFEREARALAALNHPHIAQIYGVEESGGTRALVMELVDGETLAERLARGSLALDDALPMASHIAQALQAAHDAGIIHRDLKPANIKLRSDGTVKVLDFGLAKATGADGSSAIGSGMSSPTFTSPAVTHAGLIIGTAAYMAPEQAKGKSVDRRVDVWALGCVMFEMLSGRRAFDGDDVTDLLAAVLRAEPDWTALPATVPVALQRLLHRMLEKDPKRRVSDVSVVLFAIEELTAGADDASPKPATRPARTSRAMPWVAGLVAGSILAGGSAVLLLRPAPSPPPRLARFTLALPEDQAFRHRGRHLVAISRDGTRVAYQANDRLHLRAIDQLDAAPVRGTEGDGQDANSQGRSPFFSPDGEWLGYWQGGQLKKVRVSGGAPVTITSAPNPYGASWEPGDIVLYGAGSDGVFRVSANGGTGEQIVKLEAGEQAHGPQLLPDGRTVVFTLLKAGGNWSTAGQVVSASLETGERTVLVDGGTDARYVATGHLVYGREGTLLARRFDPGTREIGAEAVPLVEGVSDSTGLTGAFHYGVAADGTLLYVTGLDATPMLFTLVWMDRSGKEEPVGVPVRNYAYARLSPDGGRVALDVRDASGNPSAAATASGDIWVWDVSRRTMTRLTLDLEANRGPVWSPDGRRLAFSMQVEGAERPYWQPADGSGPAEPLSQVSDAWVPFAFTPDGKQLLVGNAGVTSTSRARREGDVAVLALGDNAAPRPLLNGAFEELNPEVSPDGRWLAYQSSESGRPEVYVRPFPDVGSARWQISTGGGERPIWSRDGQELFYVEPAGQGRRVLMRVPVELAPSFTPGAVTPLFTAAFGAGFIGRDYDITPDGQRFLMVKRAAAAVENTNRPHMVLVQHWTEELKRLVPAK